MSAPTIGTITQANPVPGLASYTLAHTHDVGSGGGLLASFSFSNSVNVSGVTYGGVAMTQVQNSDISAVSQRFCSFFLSNPSTGNNNLVISFSGGSLWSPLSIAIYSFTACSGYGSSASNVTGSDPNEITLNCSQDSLIAVRAQAYQGMGSPGITIDGVDYNALVADFQHNTNSQAWGKLGTNSVSSGNRLISSKATSGFCYSQAVEVKGISTVAPTVTTTAISSITRRTASSGGNVTADGGATVTARGVCWNTSTNPTTANSTTSDGTGAGSFSSSITALSPKTLYYVRAYATNSAGTGYGSNVSFTTSRLINLT